MNKIRIGSSVQADSVGNLELCSSLLLDVGDSGAQNDLNEGSDQHGLKA